MCKTPPPKIMKIGEKCSMWVPITVQRYQKYNSNHFYCDFAENKAFGKFNSKYCTVHLCDFFLILNAKAL